MAGKYVVDLESTVVITVTDAAPVDWVDRCFTDEWRANLYRFDHLGEVLQHIAYNAAANDVQDLSRLDGWADIPEGAITMEASVDF